MFVWTGSSDMGPYSMTSNHLYLLDILACRIQSLNECFAAVLLNSRLGSRKEDDLKNYITVSNIVVCLDPLPGNLNSRTTSFFRSGCILIALQHLSCAHDNVSTTSITLTCVRHHRTFTNSMVKNVAPSSITLYVHYLRHDCCILYIWPNGWWSTPYSSPQLLEYKSP
jgi:hypothetical protein